MNIALLLQLNRLLVNFLAQFKVLVVTLEPMISVYREDCIPSYGGSSLSPTALSDTFVENESEGLLSGFSQTYLLGMPPPLGSLVDPLHLELPVADETALLRQASNNSPGNEEF